METTETKPKDQFTYFPNHGDEDGNNAWTVTYGDWQESDDILITCEDSEDDAKEAVKRLNEILAAERKEKEDILNEIKILWNEYQNRSCGHIRTCDCAEEKVYEFLLKYK